MNNLFGLQPVSALSPQPVGTMPPMTHEMGHGMTPPIVPQQQAPQPEYEQPSGLFGIKGTARDILGTLGDALLTQAGHQRVFAPQRKNERISEAMHGMENDPMAAIERLRKISPEHAAKAHEAYLRREAQKRDDARADRKEKRDVGEYERDERKFQDGINTDVEDRAFNFLQAADENTWSAMRPHVIRMMEKRGYTGGLEIPEKYDEDFIRRLALGATDVDDQIDNKRDDKKLTLTESEVNSRNARRSVQNRNGTIRADASAASSYASAANSRDSIRSRNVRDGHSARRTTAYERKSSKSGGSRSTKTKGKTRTGSIDYWRNKTK